MAEPKPTRTSGQEPSFPGILDEMVQNADNRAVIRWSPEDNCILLSRSDEQRIGQLYGVGKNWKAFEKQLNNYGFRVSGNKVTHPSYRPGRPDLLRTRTKRKPKDIQKNVPDSKKPCVPSPHECGPAGNQHDCIRKINATLTDVMKLLGGDAVAVAYLGQAQACVQHCLQHVLNRPVSVGASAAAATTTTTTTTTPTLPSTAGSCSFSQLLQQSPPPAAVVASSSADASAPSGRSAADPVHSVPRHASVAVNRTTTTTTISSSSAAAGARTWSASALSPLVVRPPLRLPPVPGTTSNPSGVPSMVFTVAMPAAPLSRGPAALSVAPALVTVATVADVASATEMVPHGDRRRPAQRTPRSSRKATMATMASASAAAALRASGEPLSGAARETISPVKHTAGAEGETSEVEAQWSGAAVSNEAATADGWQWQPAMADAPGIPPWSGGFEDSSYAASNLNLGSLSLFGDNYGDAVVNVPFESRENSPC